MEQQRSMSLKQLSSVSFLKRDYVHTSVCSQVSILDRCAPRMPEQAVMPRRSGFLSPLLLNQRTAAAFSTAEPAKPTMSELLRKAGKRAMGGGIPGAVAMVIQVFALMWMRTTINYQYRHGGTMMGTFAKLYKEGGIPRFYRGLLPALVQGPLSRFGDTATNEGVLTLMKAAMAKSAEHVQNMDSTKDLPIWIQTLAASLGAGTFRIALMPVDALKTTLQVEGAQGVKVLGSKIAAGGPFVLWHGALAASTATFVGHYPWFVTRNYMEELLPLYDDLPRKLMRAAVIGFTASAISDTCSNSIRVIKTTKQTHTEPITYPKALQMVIAKDGVTGLLFRGLGTKIISNGMQGLLFNVLWRMGMDYYAKLEKQREEGRQ